MKLSHKIFAPPVSAMAGDDDKGRVDILLLPDGKVDSLKGAFLVDEESFESIRAAFAATKHELVIDYEHQSLGGGYARQDGKSPAAGWIHDLRYEPGRGVVASVAWTDEARALIKTGQYKFLSPTLVMAKTKDGEVPRVRAIYNAGLTNTPAIKHDPMPRLAAKDGDDDMPQDDEKDETQDGMSRALGALRDALKAAGKINGDDDDDDIRIVETAASIVAGLKTDEDASDDDDGDEEEFKTELKGLNAVLGLKDDATLADVKAHVSKLKVQQIDPADYKAMKGQLDDLLGKERKREADAFVAECVADGKLNPNSEKSMSWASKLAVQDLKAFKELMDEAPVLFDQNQYMRNGETGKTDGRRAKIIREAVKAHKDNPQLFGKHPVLATINSYLSMEGDAMPPATKDELKEMEIN